MFDFHDTLGLLGAGLIIYCYVRLQMQREFALFPSFSFLNLLGSLCLAVSLIGHWNIAAFIVNSTMAGFSLYGVIKSQKGHGGKSVEETEGASLPLARTKTRRRETTLVDSQAKIRKLADVRRKLGFV